MEMTRIVGLWLTSFSVAVCSVKDFNHLQLDERTSYSVKCQEKKYVKGSQKVT